MEKTLRQHVQSLPQQPGVYIFKDDRGNVLYVGKAIKLRNRVSSYFRASAPLEPSKSIMVGKIANLEYIIVDSNTEALFLETTLIKRYHPPYNVVMKDDKNFSYIKVAVGESFPQIDVVRRLTKDGARYFGPYTSTRAIRLTLKHLKKIFPIKTCSNAVDDPCFESQIHRCAGHSLRPDSQRDYAAVVRQFIRFLEGHGEEVVTELHERMAAASRQNEFERAAMFRDRARAIASVLERQNVILPKRNDLDIIGLASDRNLAAVNVLVFREGKLIERKEVLLRNIADQTPASLVATFIEQYYAQSTNHPRTIIVRASPERAEEIASALQIKIQVVQRGPLAKLVKLSEANAADFLHKTLASWASDQVKSTQALEELAKALRLPGLPERIETYDISNNQGTHAVGSMVVFEHGQAKKSAYRKFTIKSFQQANDPGMLTEMLRRRLAHQAKSARENNAQVWPAPDLIILDGGKSQLNVVTKALPTELGNIPIVALAKRLEELFLPGKPYPIRLPSDSQALFLVQRMRDEAHRFAISFYRQTHRRQNLGSALDEVAGVGPKTKKKLLRAFGSVERLRRADLAAIAEVVGERLAKHIHHSIGS